MKIAKFFNEDFYSPLYLPLCWAGLERKGRIGMAGNTKLRNETVEDSKDTIRSGAAVVRI
jgi:hypothetical protein